MIGQNSGVKRDSAGSPPLSDGVWQYSPGSCQYRFDLSRRIRRIRRRLSGLRTAALVALTAAGQQADRPGQRNNTLCERASVRVLLTTSAGAHNIV